MLRVYSSSTKRVMNVLFFNDYCKTRRDKMILDVDSDVMWLANMITMTG